MAVPVPWYRVDATEQIVYLTFDDGPYIPFDVPSRVTATTEALRQKLLTLRKPIAQGGVDDNDLSATFFLNGWALTRKYPTESDPYNPGGQHP
jgi:peptidoglycan/xylan/chitin deacetylase (PgdA/CDA1 family)